MKKAIVLVTTLFAAFQLGYAQSFYDIGSVQTIEITFPFSNWDYQLDTAIAGSEGYIIATSCTINGEVFDSVGVKYKGNSSYSANNAKNPFHIELNTVKGGQDYQGYTDVKLGNGFSDPSFVREPLSYEILRNYMDAPLSNFAKVYVNGSYIGLYTSSENIGKQFAADHFYSNDNTFFKCNPAFGAGPGSMGASDLRYLGASVSSYTGSYELRSDDTNGWQELIHLCDTLNNHTADIEKILDIDRAIWMLAFNNVLVNLDSYSGAFRQNYYLYRDDNGRFDPVVWDLNMSFGGFPILNGFGGGGGGGFLDTTAMKNLALSTNSNSSNHPLIQKIWNTPQYKRMYIAHAKTILEEMFATNWYFERAQEMQDIIEADVLADNNKFFSNANFTNNLTSNITSGGGGGGFGTVPGIRNLMNGRLSFLNNTTEFTNTAPTISGVSLSVAAPSVFETVWITASITDANNAWLGYRYATPAAFTKTAMFDDGQHNDGAAGDKVYGVQLALQSALTEYYIYAENNNAGKFSPVRAEHEFYAIHASVPVLAVGEVVINEFVADNETGVVDTNGKTEDWIELYNTTDSPKSLAKLYLSDNPDNLDKWQFPDYAVIPANGYLTVWCDEDNGESGLHASFKLSSAEGSLLMNYSPDEVLSEIAYPFQLENFSAARCPNGTGDFSYGIVPTFLAFNTCQTSGVKGETAAAGIQLYPNPATTELHITATSPITTLQAFDATGVLRYENRAVNGLSERIDLTGFAAGVYWVRINEGGVQAFVVGK